MSELHTIRQIEESGEEIISALDATAYGGGTWHPSNVPFDLVKDSKQLGHLAYDLRVLEGDHVARHNGVNGESCGTVDEHDSALVLLFTFQLRKGYEREDSMRAADAAEHAMRALCSPPFRSRRTQPPERSQLAPGWLLVRCTMSVDVLFQLDPPVASVGAAPVNITGYLPVIVGDRGTGEALTGYVGSWSSTTPVTFTYSWEVDDVATGDVGTGYTDPDGEGALVFVVTATNANGSTVAYSQPLSAAGGGYAAGYAAGEAAGIITGTAAGEITGNAAGRAARVLEWRNPGLFSTTPTQFDPSSLGTWSAPNANGEYTVTMVTGIAGGAPATGSSLIWPLVSANGEDISVNDLFGVIRVRCAGANTSSPLRYWAVVMDTDDPTTARGWGAFAAVEAGSTDVITGVLYTSSVGGWSGSFATASYNAGSPWVEAVRALSYTTGGRFLAGRRNTAGAPQTGGTNHVVDIVPVTVVLPNFSGGAWICLGIGASTTGLTAGDYTIQGQSGLVALDVADAVGVGETP